MTEKNYNPEQKMKKVGTALENSAKQKVEKAPLKKEIKEEKIENAEVKEEKKKPIIKKEIVKKDHALINAQSVHVSTKYAMAICKFLKYKSIETAISDLEQVIVKKKAVPMKGEIPHRKGKGMMSGRFPKRASEHFIVLLKGLKGNAVMNGLENPVIVEASANRAQRPFGKGGIKRKRTHIRLKVMDKKMIKPKKDKKKIVNKKMEKKK
ncbi:hypothetical protein J4481_00095 [Candidatus Pacearchaeota archaeon]|nr:hypothetical protein [Candidatus Pacearchaeota archaeon]